MSRPPLIGTAVRRLVWRELAQNKGRTFAIFLLTLVPLLFAWFVAIEPSLRTTTQDLEELAIDRYGQADGVYIGGTPSDIPGNPRTVSWHELPMSIGQQRVVLMDFPVEDPLVQGHDRHDTTQLQLGAFPNGENEIAATQRVLDAYGSGLGLDDNVAWGDDRLTIVGILEPQDQFSETALVAPGLLRDRYPVTLVDWGGAVPDAALSNSSLDLRTRITDQERFPLEANLTGAVFLTGLSVATGAVAMVAWRTSAARRSRDIGLLSSSGATMRQVSAVQALQAFIISAAAVVVGAIIGTGALARWSSNSLIARWPSAQTIVALIAPAVIAVVGATAAAWWPARQAARVPLASVLAGRLAEPPAKPLSPVVGVLLMMIGFFCLSQSVGNYESFTAPLLWGTAGLVAIALGALPILARLFRTGSHRVVASTLPVAGRLVARSLSRNAGRSAATVLGIGAIVAAVWVGAIDLQEDIDGPAVTTVAVSTSSMQATNFPAPPSTGVYVAIGHPDPAVRAQIADEVAQRSSVGVERIELRAISVDEEQFASLQPQGDTDQATLFALQTIIPLHRELLSSDTVGATAPRVPALDVTAIVFPADLDMAVINELTADDRFVVAGIGVDLGIEQSPRLNGEQIAQLVIVAIGVAVATFVIALVTHVVAEEAKEETSLVELLGTGRTFTRRFLSLQTFALAGAGVGAGLVIGTMIRFVVDVGFYLPTLVLAILLALPFALAVGTYVLGAGRSTARPNQHLAMA